MYNVIFYSPLLGIPPTGNHILFFITIHMLQRTRKILLVLLPGKKNALLFQIRVTCFARYTVWFGVTRSDDNTVNDYFTQSRCMLNMRKFFLHRASQSAMNTMHYLTRIRFALVLPIIHFTLDDKVHFCGICIVMLNETFAQIRETWKNVYSKRMSLQLFGNFRWKKYYNFFDVIDQHKRN